jgi:co-chaperonin GroES (HSP10)
MASEEIATLVRPLGNRLAVRPDVALPETDIFIPTGSGIVWDSQRHLGRRGVVVAAGPGVYNAKGVFSPTAVPVGAVIRYGEFEYPTIEGLSIISEADVIGIEELAN